MKKLIITHLCICIILDASLIMTKIYGNFKAIGCLFLIAFYGLKEKVLYHNSSFSDPSGSRKKCVS